MTKLTKLQKEQFAATLGVENLSEQAERDLEALINLIIESTQHLSMNEKLELRAAILKAMESDDG